MQLNRHFAFLCIICSLIACTGLAQTRQQLDSIKAVQLEALKNTPSSADPVLKMYQSRKTPDPLQLAAVRSYKPQAFPAVFETAYFNQNTPAADSIDFYAVDIGDIDIETGKIIACDPIVMADARPFVQTFPIGAFPVQLAVAKFAGDERVAFSRIYFSEEPVVRWEFALDSGKKQIPIDGDTIYTYGVDGGIGIFIDANTNQAFSDLRKYDDNLWNRVFSGEMQRHDHGSWQYALFEFPSHNLACFSTGLGNGRYATYIGYDKKGRICRLLTDFGVVSWWKKPEKK